jgi:Glyoxalase/Bleomycin resistance protein/Dioxygenase superfamily
MFGGPVQLAYAVDDVRDAAQRWVGDGVGPFFVREHIAVRHARLRGMPATFDHSSAYAQWGPVMVELIHQHDGGDDPIVGSSGLHHVAFFVDDVAIASAALVDAGIPEAMYAETSDGTQFAFHDARAERGHYVEIYERTERLGRFYEMVRDASTGWDGAAPIRGL